MMSFFSSLSFLLCCDWMRVLQWKWEETTSGIWQSLTMLRCIVLSNMIHGARAGVRSLCWTLLHTSLSIAQLSLHLLLSRLSLSHLNHPPFYVYLFPSFFSSVPISLKGAVMLQHANALSLSCLNSGIYHIFFSFPPCFLRFLPTGFPLVPTCSHMIKHAASFVPLCVILSPLSQSEKSTWTPCLILQ